MELDLRVPATDLTAHLVDIESVSGGEQPLADAIFAAVSALPHLALYRDGNAIVARTDFGRSERVVLAGHIDTVPIAGNLPSRREGGMLYGCGSCDMKSGVAVQLRLAAQLTSAVRDITYVFYDCEEVEAARNGLLRLSRNRPELLAADFAVLMEPTGAVVEGGCQGTLQAQIVATGERAHSARSWMGSNAIHSAGGILDLLRAYQAQAASGRRAELSRGSQRGAHQRRRGRERHPRRVRGHRELPVRARPLAGAGGRSCTRRIRRRSRCG